MSNATDVCTILFAYDTLSSQNHNKFRVLFLNDISTPHRKVAEVMQLALGTLFPEADSSCIKDVSKMYYGGKELLYYDHRNPTINIESLFRNMTHCLKDRHGANHYKEKLSKFSNESGIGLTKNGLLDVTIVDEITTENSGVTDETKNGKNSPSAIIYEKVNIKEDGEIFPNQYYRINFSKVDCTSKSSVDEKKPKNHDEYRSSVLKDMTIKCKLFSEFESGQRRLHHRELMGIATNLIQVETGVQRFRDIQFEYSNLYDRDRRRKWNHDLPYMKQNEYHPQGCDGFCPYSKTCNHNKNILSTVHPKRDFMERIPGYYEELFSVEEVQDDVYEAISDAYHAGGPKFQIVKAMVGIGKTHSYLRLMSENPGIRFLIASPTNLLKDEIYTKAVKMDIYVAKTPSLEQIKFDIPKDVWSHIQRLYETGCHSSVHPYIRKILKKRDIPCLRVYMEEREILRDFDGSLITTHRYLLNMDEERLMEYDAIIIDEDILFKSIIPSQGSITVSSLKKCLEETYDSRIANKIEELLDYSETQSCIELDGFELDDDDDDMEHSDKSTPFDVPSFCLAERFYLRKASRENNLIEDTIVFFKPATFKDVKYIMVSATADEGICREYFGADNVCFHECKNAAYKGNLYQYPHKSFSRDCIKRNPGIIRRLMKKFGIGEEKVITFMKEHIGRLHFGNTEGSNTLEGEDILVIGTPYHAEFLYKLFAFNLGLDFDEDEEMTPQLVTYKGYRFRFNTFQNKSLRAIQFWMLESELEQAVGRARLLRHHCDVHLFSKFPLSQAHIIKDFDYGKE